jgi:hypothetical protein
MQKEKIPTTLTLGYNSVTWLLKQQKWISLKNLPIYVMIEAIIGNTNGCFSKKSIEPSCDLVLLFTLNLKPMSTNRENHSTLKEPEERF